jgi:hypothetical protein
VLFAARGAAGVRGVRGEHGDGGIERNEDLKGVGKIWRAVFVVMIGALLRSYAWVIDKT